MNKDNKALHISLRVCLIVTWLMSNVSFVMLAMGLKNINIEGLDKDNVVDRILEVIGDIGNNTTFYYVTMAMVGVCLLLSILTRYKTSIVSFAAKIIFLAFSFYTMITGLTYVNALGSLGGVTGLSVSGTSTEAMQSALEASSFSGDAAKVAEILTNKDEAGNGLAGYFLPIFVLFVLVITSIHCLVKRSDPNRVADQAGQGNADGTFNG